MKKYFILFSVMLVLLTCKEKKSEQNNVTSTKQEITTTSRKTNLKTIEELKMALMDARLDKVTDLFGQPDYKGENGYASLGHYIYYDKVDDSGQIKNLLICWGQNRNESNSYPIIKQVEAVVNGGHFRYGVYGDILIQKRTSVERVNNDNKIIGSLADLPVPKTALANKQIKEYIVGGGLTGKEVYSWYVNHYHANLISNNGGVAYLSMPFNDNDSCISLKMTADIAYTMKLEFSFQCDGE